MKRTISRVFLITILIMLALSAFAWTRIPDDALVATHWGIDGQANGFSTKPFALFLMPVTSAVIFLVFLVIPALEPRKENLVLSMKFYNVISIGVLLIMALTHGIILLHAFGHSFDVSTVMFMSVGLLLVAIGNFMGKLRSNFMTGIRTPWTLASDNCWNKTHRLAGWLTMLFGLWMMAAIVLKADRVLLVYSIIGSGLLLPAVTFVYSYLVWKQEPRT